MPVSSSSRRLLRDRSVSHRSLSLSGSLLNLFLSLCLSRLSVRPPVPLLVRISRWTPPRSLSHLEQIPLPHRLPSPLSLERTSLLRSRSGVLSLLSRARPPRSLRTRRGSRRPRRRSKGPLGPLRRTARRSPRRSQLGSDAVTSLV